MVVNNVTLEAVAVKPEQYPAALLPEAALAGRSNVGKSSLINCLINRKALARTSSAPGKTRTINFYNVEDKLRLVDLPGYGYAKAPKAEAEKWGGIIERYIKTRPTLRAVILLADIRHKPSADDKLMWEWLSRFGVPAFVVATKSDKISKSQTAASLKTIAEELSLAKKPLAFSSEKRTGKDELWALIEGELGITM